MPAYLALLLVLAIGSPQLAADPAGLEGLLGEADAVVVVEILTTDYTATAADGPMYAEAKVIKSVKGSLRAKQTIRFGASAWVGPSYKAGERRVVFLDAMPAGHAYYAKARWSSLDAGKLDLFIAAGAVEKCSLDTLSTFLRGLKSRDRPLKAEFGDSHRTR
jgi:hypothetical protein